MADNDMTLLPGKGSIGDITLFVRNGQRMVRQRGVPGPKRRLTPRMALQSCKISNVNTAWRSTRNQLASFFETRKPGQTAYNVFMSQNMDRARVHFTKEQARNYWCVADNFVVSLGSLIPAIEVSETEDYFVSDILVGDTPVTPETTLLDFTVAVVGCNGDRFHLGDRLTMLVFEQEERPEGQCRQILVESHTILLSDSVREYFHKPIGTEMFRGEGGRLVYPRKEGRLVAWVQSRPQAKGPDRVTTQCLVGRNPLVDKFVGLVPEYEAIASYGPLKVTSAPLPNGLTFKKMELEAQKIMAGLAPAPAEETAAPVPAEEAPSPAPVPAVEAPSPALLREGGEAEEALALVEKIRQNPQALALLRALLKEEGQ